MNFTRGSLEGLQWNTLHLPATSAIFIRPFPKITAELQLFTPQVDLESLNKQAVQIRNSFASDVIAQLMPKLHLATLEAEGISNQEVRPVLVKVNTMPQAPIADLMNEYLWGIAEPQLPEQLPQGETAALQQIISNWLQSWSPTNQLNPLPLILNSLTEAVSLPRPPQERIQLFLEELGQEIRKRKEKVGNGLLSIAERISDSIVQLTTPPPRLARQAVLTSGPLRTRGPVRTRGETAKAHISGVILNEAWKPEQTLRLLVEKGPEIVAGHLTLTVRGEGASLVGRRADLVFISEWVEVALGSAEICKSRGYKQWELGFDLDLESAGLKVRDGTLPPRVLQVVIEPTPQSGKKERRKASR